MTYQEAAAQLRAAGHSVGPASNAGQEIMVHDGCNAIAVPFDKIDSFIEMRPSWRPQRDPRFAVFAGWEER